MSSPGAPWREQELVRSFLERRQILLPLIDVQEDLVRRLLGRLERPISRFIDLGCGDGAMAELVLAAAPGSQGVLVDASEAMLAGVPGRLDESAAGRWQAINADLADPGWSEVIPAGPYDAVVSALAVHHLPAERKRALFAEAFALLAPGGLFLNLDYVSIEPPLAGLFDEDMYEKAKAHAQAGHDHGHQDPVVDDLDADHDQPDSLFEQLQWLREAGFQACEVHFKWAEAAVFGGLRPADRR